MVQGSLSLRINRPVRLITHFCLESMLRMNGVVPPLLCTFMAWVEELYRNTWREKFIRHRIQYLFQKFFLFRQYRHIRRQVNAFLPLGDETQGNFQGKDVSAEAESTTFSELNERCFDEHV